MTDPSSLTNSASTKLNGLLAALQSGKIAAGAAVDDVFSKILSDSAQDQAAAQQIKESRPAQEASIVAVAAAALSERVEKKQNFNDFSSNQETLTTAIDKSVGAPQKNDGIKAEPKTERGDGSQAVEDSDQSETVDQTAKTDDREQDPATQQVGAASSEETDKAEESKAVGDEAANEDETVWTLGAVLAALRDIIVVKPDGQENSPKSDAEATPSISVDDMTSLDSSNLLSALEGLQNRAARIYGLGKANQSTQDASSDDAKAVVGDGGEALKVAGLAQSLSAALQEAVSNDGQSEDGDSLLSLMQFQQVTEDTGAETGGFGLVSAKEAKSFGMVVSDIVSNAGGNGQASVSATPDLAASAVVAPVANSDKGRAMSSNANGNNNAPLPNGAPALTSTSSGEASAAATVSGTQKTTAGAYSFASQLSAVKTQQAATTLTAAQQVSVYLQKQAKAGSGDQMTIQLRPEELGRVEVKLEIGSDKQVQATITADNQSTLDLLNRDSEILRQALSSTGLQTDAGSLQFNLRDDGQQGASERSADSENMFGSDGEEILSAETDDTEIYYVAPGRVNVRV